MLTFSVLRQVQTSNIASQRCLTCRIFRLPDSLLFYSLSWEHISICTAEYAARILLTALPCPALLYPALHFSSFHFFLLSSSLCMPLLSASSIEGLHQYGVKNKPEEYYKPQQNPDTPPLADILH